MQFNLFTGLALLMCLLTGNCLVLYDGCYNGGTTWADLGDDDAISDAFNRLCDNMSGTYKLHDNVSQGPGGGVTSCLILKIKSLITAIMVDCQLRERQWQPHPGRDLAVRWRHPRSQPRGPLLGWLRRLHEASKFSCHLFRHSDIYKFTDTNLCNQVKSRCPKHGGELDSLEADLDSGGGDWIKALVRADPGDGTRHC